MYWNHNILSTIRTQRPFHGLTWLIHMLWFSLPTCCPMYTTPHQFTLSHVSLYPSCTFKPNVLKIFSIHVSISNSIYLFSSSPTLLTHIYSLSTFLTHSIHMSKLFQLTLFDSTTLITTPLPYPFISNKIKPSHTTKIKIYMYIIRCNGLDIWRE